MSASAAVETSSLMQFGQILDTLRQAGIAEQFLAPVRALVQLGSQRLQSIEDRLTKTLIVENGVSRRITPLDLLSSAFQNLMRAVGDVVDALVLFFFSR